MLSFVCVVYTYFVTKARKRMQTYSHVDVSNSPSVEYQPYTKGVELVHWLDGHFWKMSQNFRISPLVRSLWLDYFDRL